MRVLKICTGTWQNASRDQRELEVCKELGLDVAVLAKGNDEDHGRIEYINKFKVYRYSTRPFVKISTVFNRLCSIIQWAKFVAELQPDIISGHDYDGWTIGWLSRFYNRSYKAVLVYDAHEFELGRNKKRNKIQLLCIKIWEKKILKTSMLSIVVNDSIANELVKIYKLNKKPIVVRNIPKRWDVDEVLCEATRDELLGKDTGEGYLIIYHGAICKNRGIEQLLGAMQLLDDVKLLLLGNPESNEYMEYLEKNYINKISRHIIVKRAVPHSELWKYIGAADLCVAPIIPIFRSYYYALPNKLFEAIQAGTPILASDLPEMRHIIQTYSVGDLVDPKDKTAFATKIQELLFCGKAYFKDNIEKASEELTWENEKKILKMEYKKIIKLI